MTTPLALAVTDLVTLRKLTSRADAQQFLAERGVPHTMWPQYMHMVGTLKTSTSDIKVITVDPMRHWHWALLWLNGCSYRMLAERYNVTPSSVHAGIAKYLTKQQRTLRIPRATLEFFSQLLTVLTLQRNTFVDTSESPFDAAQRLHTAATQLGD